MTLLSRNQFRDQVFKRDNYKCVICSNVAVDAHHLIERRLWSDGGYYLDNGVSLCEQHHIDAEKTLISVENLRRIAGITKKCIPPHMYDDVVYDKWGNVILAGGHRLKGELFFDESVQAILNNSVKHLFYPWVKYPRTYHVPDSCGTSDDRYLPNYDIFKNKDIVITTKMDGENATLYNDYYHARSLDSRHHPSQSWIRNLQGKIGHNIPEGWRVCGENLYATHAKKYDNLDSYFQVFSIWDEKNNCLSWPETLEWCKLLDLTPVPVTYEWKFDMAAIEQSIIDHTYLDSEGFVIRNTESFRYEEFRYNVAKWVSPNFQQSIVHHWRSNWDETKVNGLKNG